ncbi:MAG: alpha-1,2-fucosyltransferase [bacterium]|nr:alpha-1,2-fucosyltransferase [bacterium]
MITVFLRGGIGNQMFQYALGLCLAKKNHTELVLDTVFLSDRTPRKNFSYRAYDLDVFKLTPRFTLLSKIARALPIPAFWLGLDLAGIKLRALLGVQKVVREKSDHFDSDVLSQRGNLLLFGRWQSAKYFADLAAQVREAFYFRLLPAGHAEALVQKIQSTNSISLHVRRGDFVAFKNVAQMMGETNLDYYQKATALIASRVKNPEFFIFSDDIAWCKEHIKLSYPTTFVKPSAIAAVDLQLMSLCKHQITANSTFSWWGAWLNQNPDKMVVTPERWYADSRGVEADLIPEGWIKL